MSEPCVDIRCRRHGITIALAVPREGAAAAVATGRNTGILGWQRKQAGLRPRDRFISGELIEYPNVADLPSLDGFCQPCGHDLPIPPRELGAKIQEVRFGGKDRVLRV